jgi:hypothetical protein
MRKIAVVLAAAAIVACDRKVEVESGGTVDTTADTVARFTVPDIDVGTKRDTFSLPTVQRSGDSIILSRKKVEVSRPTVDVNKKP